MKCKWENSVTLIDDSIINHFCEQKKEYKIIYFLGVGFDPRMNNGLNSILSHCSDKINMDIIFIRYNEGANSISKKYHKEVKENIAEIECIVGKNIKTIELNMRGANEDETRPSPIIMKEIIKKIKKDYITNYDEIIVDISAMPQILYFNLIQYLLSKINDSQNFGIITCESSGFDDNIKISGENETANFLCGFDMFSADMESNSQDLKVWIPMLGKNASSSLEKIFRFVVPDEICPVLPFPSQNARRCDDILLEYREILTNQFSVDRKNLIYASEFDPIQTYIRLCNTAEYYKKSFSILGQTKFIFSVESSKLMNLSALLAFLDLKSNDFSTGIAIVDNAGYEMNKEAYNACNCNLYYVRIQEKLF